MRAIALALLVGAGFYALSIIAVSYIAPWQSLLGKRFATAIAFEQALGTRWPVTLILIMAFFGLFPMLQWKLRCLQPPAFCLRSPANHPCDIRPHTREISDPSVAIFGIAVATIIGLLLGDALLVPVTEVGSMASAFGWTAACLSFWLVEPNPRMRLITGLGILVSFFLFIMKLFPIFPGHFSAAEWIALGIWLAAGLALHTIRR